MVQGTQEFFLARLGRRVFSCLVLPLIYCCSSTYTLSAQEWKSFEEVLPHILESRPKSYEDINDLMRRYRNDTLQMKELLETSKSNGYSEAQAYALNQLGIYYRNNSNYKTAIEYHLLALKVAEESKSLDMQLFSLNMTGVAYRRIDAIKTALDYNQRVVEIVDTVQNPSDLTKRNLNIALNSIGNLYLVLEQYDLAQEKFQEAFESERQLNNIRGQAINTQNIGYCLEQKGDLTKALEYYRIALALDEEINQEYGKIICKNSIAQIYLKQQKPKKALPILESLIEPMLEMGDSFVSTPVFVNLGWANYQLNNFATAEEYLNEGLSLAQTSNIPNMVEDSYRHLSILEEKRGNYRLSKEYLQKSYEIEKEITNVTNARYINDVIIRYESEKKNNQIESLRSQSEITELKLRRNKTSLLIGLLIVILSASILFILYRQNLTKNEKRMLSLEQNMLRSQMNPHFLFNSLNSIKLYIINNDKKNAVHYLNKFSKLVRKILEGSSKREITLDEELETVELYLNIENIRFSNEIRYELTVADDVQAENIKIPSLVLQPFLENAIWHGLSPKEGEKRLWIHIALARPFHIEITIRDNGIGRHAAEEAKQNRVLKRKSVGIDITRERLANFAKDYQNEFEVTILDLFEDNGEPAGTEIKLKIPTI